MYFMCLSTNDRPSLSLVEYIVRVLYSILLAIFVNSLRNLMPSSDLKNVLDLVLISASLLAIAIGFHYIINIVKKSTIPHT